jgi:hypothetical protein
MLNDRKDTLFIVVTIMKTKNKYELRMRKPTDLAPNQVAVQVGFTLKKDQWFNRILQAGPYQLDAGLPLHFAIDTMELGKTVPEKVLERMTGK